MPVRAIGSPNVNPAIDLLVCDRSLTGVLVTLDGGTVTLNFDDLSDKFVPADLDQLVHLNTGHVFADDNFKGQ